VPYQGIDVPSHVGRAEAPKLEVARGLPWRLTLSGGAHGGRPWPETANKRRKDR